MTNTLHCAQQQCSTNGYMNDLHTCFGNNSNEFVSWLLSIEKVVKSIENGPKDICFVKAEGNLLKFFYLLPINFLWNTLKEKNDMRVFKSCDCQPCKFHPHELQTAKDESSHPSNLFSSSTT